MRRFALVLVTLVCAAIVVAYQATRTESVAADPRAFVPSPEVFLELSPSFRTSVSDAYYLSMVQYFGEHVRGDQEFDSLPAMVDLVTELSPRFSKGYFFGAMALSYAGRPDLSYEVLQRGFKAFPDDYRFPAYLGFFVYSYGEGENKEEVAAQWYQKAAEIPGRPDYIPRLAATLFGKGGDLEKSVAMWGQVYMAGDKYSQQRAVDELNAILPKDKDARIRALAPLAGTMTVADLNGLLGELFEGYE